MPKAPGFNKIWANDSMPLGPANAFPALGSSEASRRAAHPEGAGRFRPVHSSADESRGQDSTAYPLLDGPELTAAWRRGGRFRFWEGQRL